MLILEGRGLPGLYKVLVSPVLLMAHKYSAFSIRWHCGVL